MSRYYLGIDQGTTNTTAVIADENFNVISKAQRAHKQIYPHPGWVEHDPEEVLNNVILAAKDAIAGVAGIQPSEIKAMGLDHQGETCVIWDKRTGKCVYNAIVWQDRRTSDIADKYKKERGERIRQICGLLPDAYHSATKLKWIIDNVEGVKENAERGLLLAGTLNSWIFWRLTGGKSHETDISSAGSMMLLDINDVCWSSELTELTGIPQDMLPEIVDTNHIYGYTDAEAFLGLRIPIAGGITDSPSGMIGGGCIGEGVLKTSYGTGSFMHFQTGKKLVKSQKGLFTRTCWMLDGQPYYLLSGASYVAGGAVSWLENIGLINRPEETEELVKKVNDSGDVYFVPAFSGLATPYWDQYARGMFIGLTAGTEKEHIIRAVLESLAYQVSNCYAAMRQDAGIQSSVMRADGGMVENSFLMQFQADMLGIPVEVPAEKETCAFGAACLAGYTMGDLDSLESLRKKVKVKKVYEPLMSEAERTERLSRWQEAARRSMNWAKK